MPFGRSQQLAKAVTDVGGSAELVLVPGADHADPVIERTQLRPTIAFLRSALTR